MKILKYILLILGVGIGIIFAFLEAGETRLDENLESITYIPDMPTLILHMIIYAGIGGGAAWLMFFCINSIYTYCKKIRIVKK